jgi:hypothetical protein
MTTKAKTKRGMVHKSYAWIAPSGRDVIEPCFVITNPPASLTPSRVKRLLEIAALDEKHMDKVLYAIAKADGANLTLDSADLEMTYGPHANAVIEALGLAGRRGRGATP